jgi:hypothetical protein
MFLQLSQKAKAESFIERETLTRRPTGRREERKETAISLPNGACELLVETLVPTFAIKASNRTEGFDLPSSRARGVIANPNLPFLLALAKSLSPFAISLAFARAKTSQ